MERKLGKIYQWKAIGQCLKGDSCSFSHEQTSGNGRGQRPEGQTSSPAPKAKAQTDEKLPSESSGYRENPSGTRGRFPCRDFLKGKCTNSSCNCWHPPVCNNYKSEAGCAYGSKCRFSHVEADGQPSKKSEKSGCKGSVALLKEFIPLGCVSRDSHPRKSMLWKRLTIGCNTHRQILHGHTAPLQKKKGKKVSIAGRHSEVRAS